MRHGVTLLELMVVLALAGVFAGFAIPAARGFADALDARSISQTSLQITVSESGNTKTKVPGNGAKATA